MSKGIDKLKEFVENSVFDDKPFQLNQATTITNKRKFADSHLKMLLGNSGKAIFKPYYERLLALYNHENKNGSN